MHFLPELTRGKAAEGPIRSDSFQTMLPWRRNKFVLAEDEAKSKPKSLGTGLTYHSILTSLLRSCPDLLPDCPFDWVGSIFHTKRQKVELNKEEPVYNVRYLGSIVTITAKGEGCTQEAVAKIWARSNYGEQSVKMRLTVGSQGIRMITSKSGDKKPVHLYSLNRITCCATDPYRPKILAWIYRHQVKNMAVVLRCHAVLVSKSEKAQAIARSLYQNATSAFSEFKRLKRQSDFRHRQQQLLGEEVVPLMPLRRLLNGQCHYRPQMDHPGSTTRLCSITEEEEEEEDHKEPEKNLPGQQEKQKVLTTKTDPTQLLSELDIGDIARLEQCQINFVSDSNNNTFSFITSLV
ncbi:Protein FAM43B [Oryzias melastigma]|uniref:Protein FAM43B n=2 Tax=Oryzias melastigma TaxID=30732 RepID=A0A834FFD9_ORYME|nr:protein FAM43B [Oryzias melastigma]KAF6733141.1 Protein FAM43B [Oryzias melastigma]